MPIKVNCLNCDKTIKASDKYAGQKAKCPGCGNVLRIPELTAMPPIPIAATVEPSAPPLPDPPKQQVVQEVFSDSGRGNTAKEQDLLVVRPSTFRTRPIKYVLVCFLIFIGIVLASVAEDPSTGQSLPWVWGIPAAGLLLLAKWHFEKLTTSLKITNRRSILRHGILSKRTREVRHSDVRLLQIDQSMIQRLLSVGSLSIASAGHGEVEIMVKGIKNPEHVKETVDGYRP
ncbi:PH domain-containing protein [Bythopirellula goksoeyrii]|uniref:Bacterial membrane flanked domain protein n=1 Tax=Bythopirellula goksoeyrii TaxID=1400387 RepID=A0A5B9Q7Y0_9BACT|nr:PH domain-containing protein [Bythopirellula goksoeyrii]QEG35127.1 Bacterial membrane flanked domain protein [Bythopirellula goksoeyrii]